MHATVERAGHRCERRETALVYNVFRLFLPTSKHVRGIYKLQADLYPFQFFILLSFGVKNCLMQVTSISVLSRQVRF